MVKDSKKSSSLEAPHNVGAVTQEVGDSLPFYYVCTDIFDGEMQELWKNDAGKYKKMPVGTKEKGEKVV